MTKLFLFHFFIEVLGSILTDDEQVVSFILTERDFILHYVRSGEITLFTLFNNFIFEKNHVLVFVQ